MAAAYAALVSLTHTIKQIKNHPHPPISLDQKQVEYLVKKVASLQDFLGDHSHIESKEAAYLESRIADAAHAAEDAIESHIVDGVLDRSTADGEEISSDQLHLDLQKAIEEMDLIEKEVMEIKEKLGVQHIQLRRNSSISADSLRSPYKEQRITVGLNDSLYDALDKLTGGLPDRQIIPIVGMGGIGKTTLARTIYQHQMSVHHFDLRAWAAISQVYVVREILLEILLELDKEDKGCLSQMNESELGDKLHQKLYGRRYLIVIDDIWDIEIWEKMNLFLPDNKNGSRILLTTRLSELGFQLTDPQSSRSIEMKLLDEEMSWDLLQKTVFWEENCPPNLEEIGKEIAKNCKGLPLSIVVIGGLLAKSEQTLEYWEYISRNLNSILSLEDDERCLKILHTSYRHLPIHLKPCFLYIGVLPEDHPPRASALMAQLAAEGFLKPIPGKSPEAVAEEYFKDLISRNLILVESCGYNGKVTSFRIHDLLRELCLREAEKQSFFCFLREQSLEISQGINSQRRICVDQHISKKENLDGVGKAMLCRSLIWESEESLALFSLRLLRVFSTVDRRIGLDGEASWSEDMLQLVNTRYLFIEAYSSASGFPSRFSLLWNLQTLILQFSHGEVLTAPAEIWKMTQLKVVKCSGLKLPDPPAGDEVVLENLQTLLRVHDLKCGEEVVKRIPNIKKLKLYHEGGPVFCFNNLGSLNKLESLVIDVFSRWSIHLVVFGIDCFSLMPRNLVQNLNLPHSLKKLTLNGTNLEWGDLGSNIGLLPNLEVLKLLEGSCIGSEWETVEGQFCSLRILEIHYCDLMVWTTESSHFPCLERLVLFCLPLLMEIPSCIGDIATLQSIWTHDCSEDAICSANRIREEQEELGNLGIKVEVSNQEWSTVNLVVDEDGSLSLK